MWQPIETANRSQDHEDVLLLRNDYPRVVVGYWSDALGEWRESFSCELIRGVKSWMPVPAIPEPPK